MTNSLRVERKHTKLKLAHSTLKVLPVASSRTMATRRFLLPSNLQPCKSVTAGGFASLSPMTAAYILLSDDRFLSTLTHCRPSDVVSVRSNNGFWWVSVSKASLWLLHRWVSEFPEVYHGGGIAISQGENRNFIFNPTVRHGGCVTSARKWLSSGTANQPSSVARFLVWLTSRCLVKYKSLAFF